ncbi:angiotensin-converting enzyme-like [Diabrotica virgifera virgifera]|uniref:Angiotensin-converting enzyme n=1 Tax=Diabrotica virgifera virgifera TaxID=50390 RepID=A0ABM5KAK7_DIAVI|nr:angiotensin-converting enzyme-like [Diabrotica virgifera virgifera]
MCDISDVKKTPFVIIYFVNFHLILAQVSLPPAFIPNDQRRDPYNNNGRGDPYNIDGRGFSSSTPFPPYSSTPFPPRDFPYNPNDPRNDYNQNFGQRPSDLPPSFVSKTNVNNPQNFNNRQGDFSAQRPLNPQNFGGRSFDDDFNRRNRVDGDRDIRGLLQALDIQASQMCTNNVAAQWNFETNINEATQLEAINAQQFYSDFQHGVWDLLNKVGNINSLDPQTFRQIKYYSVIGPSALPPEELDRYNRLINDMLVLYNTGSICAFNDPLHCGLRLQPDLSKIMAKSRNWDELQYVWTEWRRNSGQKMKDAYEQMVKVSNNAARANNFTDTADYWSFPFESPSLMLDMEDAWEEVKPLYELLLTYVRRKLREYYGPEKINRQAPLPAHILGNMWGQSWSNIFDITQPYPGQSFLDVTPEMIKQGYTPPDLFRLAEDFFVSMNMSVLPLEFWQGSVLQEPLDRIVLCQPSAWDFCNRRDFRIKMCTNVNMKDLITAHHEMAHIYYFIQYKNQPKVFRDGANPAFHEAIGEAIGLSVGTPRHLQALGLVQKSIDRVAVDINFLYSMALDKIVFLPFALVMDKWRYDVFKGVVQKEEYNCHWWLLSERYQGIKPPVLRSEIDFDPGSKYHIPANIPYLRYFVSTILQFQIYRSLCIAAGQYSPNDPARPLHECDIYRSKEAGRILTQIMEKGSSQSWRDVLFQATGESRLDGRALREYFRPLEDWLRNENLRTGEFVGWLYDGDYCKQSIETAGLQVYGGFYNNSQTPTITSFLLLISLFFCYMFSKTIR